MTRRWVVGCMPATTRTVWAFWVGDWPLSPGWPSVPLTGTDWDITLREGVSDVSTERANADLLTPPALQFPQLKRLLHQGVLSHQVLQVRGTNRDLGSPGRHRIKIHSTIQLQESYKSSIIPYLGCPFLTLSKSSLRGRPCFLKTVVASLELWRDIVYWLRPVPRLGEQSRSVSPQLDRAPIPFWTFWVFLRS